jgi:hypothetical protein
MAEYLKWERTLREQKDDRPLWSLVEDAEDLVRRELLEHVREHIAASIRRDLGATGSRGGSTSDDGAE